MESTGSLYKKRHTKSNIVQRRRARQVGRMEGRKKRKRVAMERGRWPFVTHLIFLPAEVFANVLQVVDHFVDLALFFAESSLPSQNGLHGIHDLGIVVCDSYCYYS